MQDERKPLPTETSKAILLKNSSWGIVSQATQTVLLSLFFIILARQYPTDEFAKYLIAVALTQIVSAFSSCGLGHWFIREIVGTRARTDLVSTFFKAQLYFGVVFYLGTIAIAFLLYDDQMIRVLAVLVGANIVFDNITNTLKNLNIADFEQRKTFIVLTTEAFLKFGIGCVLLFSRFSLISLCVVLLVIRVLTLNLFLKVGTSSTLSFKALLRHPAPFADIKSMLFSNWPWIIIGGISIVNWRIATIMVSKQLSLTDVAIYEISYRLFAIAQIVPVIVATTVFPMLVKAWNATETTSFRAFYRQMYMYYLLFGLLAFSVVYSFADVIIPVAFGPAYTGTSSNATQMFLTMVIFPTAFLQGNVLFAMKMEKTDMWLNLCLLTMNVGICTIGLRYYQSIVVVNVALFISLACFHVMQDVLLIKRHISSIKQVIASHATIAIFVSSYVVGSAVFDRYILFTACWTGIAALLAGLLRNHEFRARIDLLGASS